jgi:hypothetical protein
MAMCGVTVNEAVGGRFCEFFVHDPNKIHISETANTTPDNQLILFIFLKISRAS